MKSKLTMLFCLFVMFAPRRLKIFIYNRYLGGQVDSTARIGLSFIRVKKLVIGAHARIGHFNVIRNLELFEVGDHVTILNSNWFNAIPLGSDVHFRGEDDRFPAFKIGEHSAVGKKNIFDCNNMITIGKFSAIAGTSNYFSTHGINLQKNLQESAPILIGDYCRVATYSVVLKGSCLPDGSTLAANSTLHKAFSEPYTLYSGVPAAAVKKFDPDWAFFHRKKGFVD